MNQKKKKESFYVRGTKPDGTIKFLCMKGTSRPIVYGSFAGAKRDKDNAEKLHPEYNFETVGNAEYWEYLRSINVTVTKK